MYNALHCCTPPLAVAVIPRFKKSSAATLTVAGALCPVAGCAVGVPVTKGRGLPLAGWAAYRARPRLSSSTARESASVFFFRPSFPCRSPQAAL